MKIPPVTTSLLAAVLVLFPKAGAKILQQWTFDDNKPLHNLIIQGDAPKIIPDPKDPHNKVMLSFLKPNAKRPERSEVMPGTITVGEERWVGVRTLRPNRVQNGFNCFFQLGPVDGAPGHGGGGLYQLNSYGKDTWAFRGFMERVGGKGFCIPMGGIQYGNWDVWVFHVKLRADKEGLIEVWRNGALMTKQSGQNAFPGDRMRIKWGVYVGKGSKVAAEISACYDDITIGDETSGYDEVAPKKGAVSTQGRPSRLPPINQPPSALP